MFEDLAKLIKFLDKEVRRPLFIAVVTGIFLFLAEYAFIFALQGFLISIGIVDVQKLDLPKWFPSELHLTLTLFLCIGVLRALTLMIKGYLVRVTNQNFIKIQRSKIFSYVMYNADKTSSHEIMSLFTDTLSRVGSAILDFTGLFTTLTSTALLFVAGARLAPIEMLIGIVGLLLIFLPLKVLNNKINVVGKGLTREWSLTNKNLLEGMRQNYFFRAHGLESSQIGRGLRSIANYQSYYRRFFIFSALKNGIPNFAGIILFCLITWISVNYLDTSNAKLLAFLYIFIRLAQGGGELSVVFGELRLNINSINELIAWNNKIDASKSSLDKGSLPMARREPVHKLEFQNVNFMYNTTDLKIIRDLSFQLVRGDILVVRGESGSGKSTLLSLLLGINSPNNGDILVNNISLDKIIFRIKPSLSYIGPEPFLFEGTIRENLLFGNPISDMSDDMIWHALDFCQASEFVSEKKMNLDFFLEESAEISTGQKQRLSLCRAILRKPDLLILDEATANLDPVTENKIMESLQDKSKDMITIIVTHKKSLYDFGNKKIELSTAP